GTAGGDSIVNHRNIPLPKLPDADQLAKPFFSKHDALRWGYHSSRNIARHQRRGGFGNATSLEMVAPVTPAFWKILSAAMWEIELKRLTPTFCPFNWATSLMEAWEYIGMVNVFTTAAT